MFFVQQVPKKKMDKVITSACFNTRVLSLLTRKPVIRVSAIVFSLTHSRTAGSAYSTITHSSTSGKHVCNKMMTVPHIYYVSRCNSTVAQPSNAEVKLNRQIMLTTTVQSQLELYRSVQASVNIVNKVAFLFNIAKVIGKCGSQCQVLEQERERFKQGKGSVYIELLESIAETIKGCQCRHLANVMWALGKIQEKQHRLVHVCKHEILQQDVSSFNYAEICQILNGCANLDFKAPEIFSKFQEAILAERLSCTRGLEDQEMSGILLSYAKTNNGTKELFDYFLKEVASRNMAINSRSLADTVWSFAKKNIDSDSFFSLMEGEIIRRGTSDFENADIVKILWAFSMAGRGSVRLFYLLEGGLIQRGIDTFLNVELVEIVWSFAKRNIRNAKLFDVVEREILHRGVSDFKTHELVIILYSFIHAKRESVNVDFIKKIEAELSLRDSKEFNIGDFNQVIWSLGRANLSDSKLFDLAEAEVAKCNLHKVSRDGKLMLMRGFVEAQRGSKELYQFLYSSISARDLSDLTEAQICEFVWCFSLANVEAEKLFDFLQKEILNREKYRFTRRQLSVIRKSFLRAGKGSKELLNFVTSC